MSPTLTPTPTPTPQTVAARRAAYRVELALETDQFHEPRRPDCPWCGSRRLRTRLRTPDLLQRMPGTFVVDECEDCAHAFQNPRLTAEGLAFHHRDFRDDTLPARLLRTRGGRRSHEAAARAMLPYPEPESWLDVGTGYGRFPAVAREVHPYTAFDGTDPTPRVERARVAGRIEEAYRGRLPDLVERLRARYDVVSLFRHLEYSPDPREELRAALAVLRPGGHLLVEVPDPDCAFGALLGKWWLPYGQPRHLHLMPLRNLLGELDALGCTVVSTDRREPHIPYDLTGALALRLSGARFCTPLFAAAFALDQALAPLLRRTRFSNSYRVIARRGMSA
ncbi:class I SAM-dependent methyltransferase [Streptomyces sp. HC44]|uniref:Class I SAM-dependent methyltransferase n=1 Tax=Streptomyces scabichelini TaxID=2711217 RepID=A0A6G4V8Q4_9ACTN|nr:class I SAM-dependent methyltransferase [Streptomyces scabichelini]NGO10492.1 class I SAM-dependent methyltransferase [Streptomyces scabichelini]